MMGVNGKEVEVIGNKAKTLNAYGVDIMSMGILMKEERLLFGEVL